MSDLMKNLFVTYNKEDDKSCLTVSILDQTTCFAIVLKTFEDEEADRIYKLLADN